MPINAVQFTILSIIAIGYKYYVASYRSEASSSLLPVSKTATIDKTLFYETCNLSWLQILARNLKILDWLFPTSQN